MLGDVGGWSLKDGGGSGVLGSQNQQAGEGVWLPLRST